MISISYDKLIIQSFVASAACPSNSPGDDDSLQLVSYLNPLLVGSYAPVTDQSGTPPPMLDKLVLDTMLKFSKAKYIFYLIFNSPLI